MSWTQYRVVFSVFLKRGPAWTEVTDGGKGFKSTRELFRQLKDVSIDMTFLCLFWCRANSLRRVDRVDNVSITIWCARDNHRATSVQLSLSKTRIDGRNRLLPAIGHRDCDITGIGPTNDADIWVAERKRDEHFCSGLSIDEGIGAHGSLASIRSDRADELNFLHLAILLHRQEVHKGGLDNDVDAGEGVDGKDESDDCVCNDFFDHGKNIKTKK